MTNICKKTALFALIALCGVLTTRVASAADTDTDYTGMYNDRQIVPNSMAIFCKMNAEDMIKDFANLHNCVNKIVSKINNSDAQVSAEGKKDLEQIKFDMMKNMLAQALTKSATISNYEEVQNSMMESGAQTQTEHDDNAAIANTVAVLTDVINSMRDLYADKLKLTALEGIDKVDPQVIKDVMANADTEDGASKKADDTSAEYTSTEAQYTIEHPHVGDIVYNSGNQCVRNICTGLDEEHLVCQPEYLDCPDGEYLDPSRNNAPVLCKGGKCEYIGAGEGENPNNGEGFANADVVEGEEGEYAEEGAYYDDDFPDYKGSIFLGNGQCNTDGQVGPCKDGYHYLPDGRRMSCVNGSCSMTTQEDTVITGKAPDVVVHKDSSYSGDNQCTTNGVTGPCEDGIYYTEGGQRMECYKGNCSMTTPEDVVITPESSAGGDSDWKY